MFDPFSALGVLGFTTGALGFIVSTVPKIDEKIQEIRECQRLLRSFTFQLGDAYLDLKKWHSIWVGPKAYSHAFYVYIWGLEGLEIVNLRVNDILEMCREIEKILRWPGSNKAEHQLDSSDLDCWKRFLDDHEFKEAEILGRHLKAGTRRKILFSLFHNANLKGKIDALEKSVKGLDSYTRSIYRLGQDGDPELSVKAPELLLLKDRKAFVDRMSKIGTELYGRLANSPRFECAIELDPPEAGHDLNMWSEMDQMYIDLMVRPQVRRSRIKARRLRIQVEDLAANARKVDYLDIIEQTIEAGVLNNGKPECYSGYDHFFDLLELPLRRSRALKKLLIDGSFSERYGKKFKEERANLVYGLGHWTVVLWNTPWFSDLCTCRIHCTYLADGTTSHSFLPCRNRKHLDFACLTPPFVKNRLLFLGVTLAEMALALPVNVNSEGENTTYLVGEEVTSRQGLLKMLRENFGRDTIQKAVSFCLAPDSAKLGLSLRPEHLDKYCQNILLPLQMYHQVLKVHCHTRSRERLRSKEALEYDQSKENGFSDYYEDDYEDEGEESDSSTGTGSSFRESYLDDDEDSISHTENEHMEFSNDVESA